MERTQQPSHRTAEEARTRADEARARYLRCLDDYRALAAHVRTLTGPHERLDGGEKLVEISRQAQQAYQEWMEARRRAGAGQ
jgi:hypothetical protein